MRVGLKMPQLGEHVDRGAVRGFCESADELGFDSLWVQEHLFYPLQPVSGYSGVPGLAVPAPYRRTLSALELLGAAASWTERVRLGHHLLVVGNHHPLVLAQRLATLDVLSAGRVDVGLGVGWSKDEHDLIGTDFATRGRRFDDFIGALLACWGPDPVEYEGPFFSIPTSAVAPKPLQVPRPPLLVGFFSDRGVGRAVSRFDGWLNGVSVSEGADRLRAMNELRRPDQPPLTIHGCAFPESPLGTDAEAPMGVPGVVETVLEAKRLGFDEMIIDCNFWSEVRSPAHWAEVPMRLRPVLDAVVAV